MIYKFAPDADYEDFAGGRVLYHRGGMPSFPVRLGSEIFHRCLYFCEKKSGIRLYDPCCGGAYLLTVLGLLCGDAIEKIIGSDIDNEALSLAQDNLSLLTPAGRKRRLSQLENLYMLYHKPSHQEALHSLKKLCDSSPTVSPQIRLFQADILHPELFHNVVSANTVQADIILTDVPYGSMTMWNSTASDGEQHLNQLFDNLSPVRNDSTITAVISNKQQKMKPPQNSAVCRLDKFCIGKRKVEIYRG